MLIQTSVWLPDELFKKLRAESKKKKLPMAEIVRQCVLSDPDMAGTQVTRTKTARQRKSATCQSKKKDS